MVIRFWTSWCVWGSQNVTKLPLSYETVGMEKFSVPSVILPLLAEQGTVYRL
jgi:hypothetical protein